MGPGDIEVHGMQRFNMKRSLVEIGADFKFSGRQDLQVKKDLPGDLSPM